MSAVAGLRVNRPFKFQVVNHSLWSEREKFADDLAQFFIADFARAFCIDEDRKRVSEADDVRQLNFAGVREAGRDDVLGDVSCHIACGPVNFCGVFAAEASAAVSAFSAVGIDDNFSAGQAAVAGGAADDKFARRVDVKDRAFID